MKKSIDYYDYAFKEGKLAGKFEDMYKYSSEMPWPQDKTGHSMFSDIDITILKQYKYESICEVGCGFGYFSNRLYSELCSAGVGPYATPMHYCAEYDWNYKGRTLVHYLGKVKRLACKNEY